MWIWKEMFIDDDIFGKAICNTPLEEKTNVIIATEMKILSFWIDRRNDLI